MFGGQPNPLWPVLKIDSFQAKTIITSYPMAILSALTQKKVIKGGTTQKSPLIWRVCITVYDDTGTGHKKPLPTDNCNKIKLRGLEIRGQHL